MHRLWSELAASAGLNLSDAQLAALARYLDLLLDANRRMNLTRIDDRAAAEIHHVADALTLLPHLPAGAIALADVGSGGGVPGIPLAIVRNDARVVLIESTKKKAAFLRGVIDELKLSNVAVTDARAEHVARQVDSREHFDVVTARALGQLVWIAEWCLPLARKGGKVLAMKGPKVHEELPAATKAIKRLGGGAPVIHPVRLPGGEHHVIVEIAKIAHTDPKFPRDPTVTKGKPIA
jgi:16S rRNA (guanine527-N7)-methyltransferase